jgi:hypothetical protein
MSLSADPSKDAPQGNAQPLEAYEPPKVQSLKLSEEAAEALT